MKRLVAADRGDELIGIWWMTDDDYIFGMSKPVEEGYNDFGNIQYDSKENHLTLYRQAVKDYLPEEEQDSALAAGYKSMWRGRCYYESPTMCFVITCSESLLTNSLFKRSIIDYFQLNHARHEFRALEHYKYKQSLTGNPAVDGHYYD